MAVSSVAFLQVRGFDEGFFLFFEDVDLCRRVARADWEVVIVPLARVSHIHGASTRLYPSQQIHWARYRSQIRYFAKHYGIIGLVAAASDLSCLRWRL